MATDPTPTTSLAFGRYQLFPHRRELHADGQPLKLGGRAYDVLMTLMEARGAVVSRDVLMARVWPDRVVEENALPVQIGALRAALGRDRVLIRTVTGRGYQFTGEINMEDDGSSDHAAQNYDHGALNRRAVAPGAALPPTNLPTSISGLIGRDEELLQVVSLAASHRLVTLTGPGGIGKTRLALEAARGLLPAFPQGVWLAEFSPVSDPALVPATVAAAVGLELAAGEISAQRVAQGLGNRRLLLAFDTCEHVVDAAAELAEAILRTGAGVSIIATSREPLRVEGEQIHAVPPLAVPGDGEDPWQSSAVQLFVARSHGSGAHLPENQQAGLAVATICQQLDGIPLAIELAAGRVAALGVEGLAAQLDDRFALLTGGRRTALPRHHTLRATLDWSHGLLTEAEQIVLRRLGIFAGIFSIEAAQAVVADPDVEQLEVVEWISGLVAKSLVSVEADHGITRYRILDTTRAYALVKLEESGERERLARRHAEYYRVLFERADAECETRPKAEWLTDYRRQIDNLRVALDWAFSPTGDTSIGVATTVVSLQLWLQLSMVAECRRYVERALASNSEQGSRGEMQLQAALGLSLNYTTGRTPGKEAALTRALQIAESLGDTEYELLALRGLWAYRVDTGAYRMALALAEQFTKLAATKGEAAFLAIGDRMAGIALYVLGDLTQARRRLEHHLARPFPPLRHSRIVRFLMDPRVAIRTHLARILWCQGFPDQAAQTARLAVDDAEQKGDTIALCHALAQAACPVALSTGDLPEAERFAAILLGHAGRLRLAGWIARGHCLTATTLIIRGNFSDGLPLLRTALAELGEEGPKPSYTPFLAVFARGLGRSGRLMEGMAIIDDALALAEQHDERWNLAELLRTKGELLAAHGPSSAGAAAEDHFRRALDRAREQGALSWELRTTTSLAKLLRDQGRVTEARELLTSVYDRFSEGFGTADLLSAKALIDELNG